MSGLKPNLQKSLVFFSGVQPDIKEHIIEIMGFKEGKLPVKYLGLPLVSTRLTKEHCHDLVTRIAARILNWTAKSLSYAGRLQLVKSVLTSMHIYWTSIFTLPKSVITEVEKMCRSFLWHGIDKGKKGGMVAWSMVCQSKVCGGLGIKPAQKWNQTALVRYIWELVKEKNTLWALWVIKIKLRRLNFWGITKPTECNWNWRNLLKLRKLAKAMFVYKLGDGKRFSFWFDPWCHVYSLVELFPEISLKEIGDLKKAVVCDFWRNNCWYIPKRWNPTMLRVMEFLNGNFTVTNARQDLISWGLEKRGEFTVKSALRGLMKPEQQMSWTKIVWLPSNLPRHSFIIWLALHNRLMTREKLFDWGVANSNVCALLLKRLSIYSLSVAFLKQFG